MVISIMKMIIFSLCFALLTKAQNKCTVEVDEKTNKPMFIGLCDRTAFEDSSFASWFNTEYNDYSVDSSTLDLISTNTDSLFIKIILGTWCGDSREQVPRFLKILDYLRFPTDNLLLIFVDRKKLAGDFDIEDLDIKLVPTIIIYKNQTEIGRIIETPKISLEEDLVDVLFSY